MQATDVDLGHLVHPEAGVHPGVVLVHDVWGLSDHTRDVAGRLAAEGFSVLAVDLYRRLGDWKITDPGAWMRSLSDPEAVADVAEAVAFLAEHPASAGRPVGAAGFCMGGMVVLLAACADTGLAAAVPFYGLLSHDHGLLHQAGGPDPARKPRSPLAAAPDLRCPALCFFGDRDDFVPLADIEELRRGLASAAAEAEVVVFSGAGHAFMNDTRAEAYRPEAAREAWARMLAFFRRHLGG